jgi:hypothetical protein
MGILELKYNDKTITLHHKLLKKEDGFYWLIDSEVEDAIIEIKRILSYGMKVFFKYGNWDMVYLKMVGTEHGRMESGRMAL